MTKTLPDGRIEFRCYRPDAARIKLAGSFSDWQPLVDMMREEVDGVWTGHWVARLPLRSPASSEPLAYRFEVDGRWCIDFSAPVLISQGRISSALSTRKMAKSN